MEVVSTRQTNVFRHRNCPLVDRSLFGVKQGKLEIWRKQVHYRAVRAARPLAISAAVRTPCFEREHIALQPNYGTTYSDAYGKAHAGTPHVSAGHAISTKGLAYTLHATLQFMRL